MDCTFSIGSIVTLLRLIMSIGSLEMLNSGNLILISKGNHVISLVNAIDNLLCAVGV